MLFVSENQMGEDECPELGLTLQNHFRAIDVRMGKSKHSKHRQSLVTLSRRHSMVQMLESLELDGPTPMRRISLSNAPNPSTNLYLHHLQHQSSLRSMDASVRRANVSNNMCNSISITVLSYFYLNRCCNLINYNDITSNNNSLVVVHHWKI